MTSIPRDQQPDINDGREPVNGEAHMTDAERDDCVGRMEARDARRRNEAAKLASDLQACDDLLWIMADLIDMIDITPTVRVQFERACKARGVKI